MDDPTIPPKPTATVPTSRHAESASESIVTAVADAKDVSPMDLPPLYSSIDPDALDSLVGSPDATRGEPEVSVTLTYDSYEVTVVGDGVSLTEKDR